MFFDWWWTMMTTVDWWWTVMTAKVINFLAYFFFNFSNKKVISSFNVFINCKLQAKVCIACGMFQQKMTNSLCSTWSCQTCSLIYYFFKSWHLYFCSWFFKIMLIASRMASRNESALQNLINKSMNRNSWLSKLFIYHSLMHAESIN